mmetsp:Transcript_20434/g.51450  ORF Transcript_20434/g.51450 Transcript_20434/m.51450 type:complete len:232 (-) Transcript_20434:1280-1975(-)
MPPGGVGSVMLPGLLGVAKNPLGSQVSPPGDAIPLPMLGKLVKHDVISEEFLFSVLRPSMLRSRLRFRSFEAEVQGVELLSSVRSTVSAVPSPKVDTSYCDRFIIGRPACGAFIVAFGVTRPEGVTAARAAVEAPAASAARWTLATAAVGWASVPAFALASVAAACSAARALFLGALSMLLRAEFFLLAGTEPTDGTSWLCNPSYVATMHLVSLPLRSTCLRTPQSLWVHL